MRRFAASWTFPLLLALAGVGRAEPVAAPVPGLAWLTVEACRGKDPVQADIEVRRVLAPRADLGPDGPRGTQRWPQLWSAEPEELRAWLAPQAGAGAPAARVQAGPDGRARVEGLEPGLYEVLGKDGERLEARVLVEVHARGEHVHGLLRFSRGSHVFKAQVLHADGTPFRGTLVLEQPRALRRAVPWLDGAWERETDAEGRLELSGLEGASVTISAIDPGRARVCLGDAPLPGDGAWTGRLPSTAVARTGSVRSLADDAALDGAEVFAYATARNGTAFDFVRTATAADGSFTLPRMHFTSFLRAEAAGHARTLVELTGLPEALPTLRLDRAARLAVQVVGPEGRPVPDVRVRVESRQDGLEDPPRLAATDAEGKVTFEGLAPAEVRCDVWDAAWFSPGSHGHDWTHGTALALQLEPGATVHATLHVFPALHAQGRVVDAQGRPFVGALVRSSQGPLPDKRTVTDAEGRFEARGLGLGDRVRLGVSAPEGVAYRSVYFVAGTKPPDVVLERREPRWRTVRVLDRWAEAPVDGATVEAYLPVQQEEDGTTFLQEEATVLTAPDGIAWVGPLPQGEVRLRVRAPGPSDWVDVEVPSAPADPAAAVLEAMVELEEGGPVGARTTIEGRVLASPGAPLPERLALLRSEAGEPAIGALKGGGTSVPVDEDGRFRLEDLAEGRYVLRASGVVASTLHEGQVLAAAGDRDVRLALRPATRRPPPEFRFRLRAHDDRPVPAATLWILEGESGAKEWRTVPVDARQEAVYAASKPSVVELARVLVLDARTHTGRALPYGMAEDREVRPGDEPWEIVLPAEATLEGQVLGPEGHPVRGVRVAWLLDHRRTDAMGVFDGVEVEREVLSDEQGRFRLGGLPGHEVPLMVTLDVPHPFAPEPPVCVLAWLPCLFKLATAVQGPLRIVDPEGRPVVGAYARIEPEDDDLHTFDANVKLTGIYVGPGWVRRETDAEGRVRFTRLDPRRPYNLNVEAPETRPELSHLALPAWRPQASEETIMLPRRAPPAPPAHEDR
jgi:protocatechuate 3,4-dioxygenase beta subunit